MSGKLSCPVLRGGGGSNAASLPGGAQRVAMDDNGARSYLFGDHLGSTSVVMPTTFGLQPVYARYKPWGESRDDPSVTLPTDYRFTGQQWHENIGLYNYGARW